MFPLEKLKPALRKKLQNNQPLILDGPIGTELLRRGYVEDPGIWTAKAALKSPELLKEVYAEYVNAGADIVTANTFRCSSYRLDASSNTPKQWAHASVALLTELLEELDKESSVSILGSVGPIGDCYHPDALKEESLLRDVHLQTVSWLIEAGCEIILGETIGTRREAKVIVESAKQLGAPLVGVSFIVDQSGTLLLGGESLADSAQECLDLGANLISINCVHSSIIEKSLEILAPIVRGRGLLGAYANADRMELQPNKDPCWIRDLSLTEDQRIQEYCAHAKSWVQNYGIEVIGSCCGTNSKFIESLARSFDLNQ